MLIINSQYLIDSNSLIRNKRQDPKDLPETNPLNLPIGDEDMNEKPPPPIEDRPCIRYYASNLHT